MTTLLRNIAIIMPGLLVAATGVGAGDLATASIVGSELGVAVLWAVAIGGLFKFVLTEGIARWQLVHGESLIESLCKRLGKIFVWVFLSYIILWSFFVGSALMSASGVALHALFPVMDAQQGKIVFGVIVSIVGLAMVRMGGYALFEKMMGFSVALMFAVVLVTAFMLWPGWKSVLSGIFILSIPKINEGGLSWTVALIGGVGGTLTIFCYGYWMEQKQRHGSDQISVCRIDLGVAYTLTVLFGMAMVIVGSSIQVEGKGAGLLVALSYSLKLALGEFAMYVFLTGAFFAIFSSLLGVWQAVPYLFSDVCRHLMTSGERNHSSSILENSKNYRLFQMGLATVPAIGLLFSFKEVQKFYAVIGTLFMPFLALALLRMCNQSCMATQKNGYVFNGLLCIVFIFFAFVAYLKVFNT